MAYVYLLQIAGFVGEELDMVLHFSLYFFELLGQSWLVFHVFDDLS